MTLYVDTFELDQTQAARNAGNAAGLFRECQAEGKRWMYIDTPTMDRAYPWAYRHSVLIRTFTILVKRVRPELLAHCQMTTRLPMWVVKPLNRCGRHGVRLGVSIWACMLSVRVWLLIFRLFLRTRRELKP